MDIQPLSARPSFKIMFVIAIAPALVGMCGVLVSGLLVA